MTQDHISPATTDPGSARCFPVIAHSISPSHSAVKPRTACGMENLPQVSGVVHRHMKKASLFLPALLVLALAACDTFESRSHEKAATFESLSPAEREKLKRGVIELGNTPEMVYIALGRPDEKHESTTTSGVETVWTYDTYHQEYEGNIHSGYRRILVWDPRLKRYFVFYDPVYTDVYSEHKEENIKIKFKNGKVTEVEQPKSERR